MAANNEDTIPGFMLESPNFIIKFISGYQRGEVSHILEYETDWMEVMLIILNTLEMFPVSVEAVEHIAARALEEWITSHDGAEDLGIKAEVKMEEKMYFCPPLGSKKSLKLSFTDKFKTDVIFHIKKKSTMKSLKNLGAEAVANMLEEEEDIAKLEIPLTLIFNLVKAFRNDWSERYYRNNIKCCKDHLEKTKNVQDFCTFLKML